MHRPDYLETIREHLRTAYHLSDEKIDAVLPRFLSTLCTWMTKLEKLADDGNSREDISRAGHALKGALLNLGLMNLADKAFQVEQFDKQTGRNIEHKKIIAELKDEITEICNFTPIQPAD